MLPRRGPIAIAFAAFLTVLAAAGGAAAHQVSLSRGAVVIGDATVEFTLYTTAHDLAHALGVPEAQSARADLAMIEALRGPLAEYLARGIAVRSGETACSQGTATTKAVDGGIALAIPYDCGQGFDQFQLFYRLFFELDATHRVIGTVTYPTGEEEPFFLDKNYNLLDVEIDRPKASPAEHFWRVFRLGVEHILSGYDHILFLLALVLMPATLWDILKIVTAFTISHSLTLALAWSGWIDLPAKPVEVTIALSVAIAALLNLWQIPESRRWPIAGGFGLVHGLGFYSALSALSLTGGGAVSTLLAFNLGVEAGQIAIVAAVLWPLLLWQRQSWFAPSMKATSLAIIALAIWWAVDRGFS